MDYLPHVEKFMPWGMFCSLARIVLLLLVAVAVILVIKTRRRD